MANQEQANEMTLAESRKLRRWGKVGAFAALGLLAFSAFYEGYYAAQNDLAAGVAEGISMGLGAGLAIACTEAAIRSSERIAVLESQQPNIYSQQSLWRQGEGSQDS